MQGAQPGLCDNLEGREGGSEGGDICILMADSRCIAQTNTTFKKNYPGINRDDELAFIQIQLGEVYLNVFEVTEADINFDFIYCIVNGVTDSVENGDVLN